MVRFISESVITGFVTGVAALMILGQLSKLTGYHGNVAGSCIASFSKTFFQSGRNRSCLPFPIANSAASENAHPQKAQARPQARP
jgi:hypothetical protein